METAVKNRLQSLQFGQPQTYKNIVIMPVIAPAEGTVQYDTLGEALGKSELTITEVSEGGSVPNLLVDNRADRPVLLLDGEELAGAKQNRVLNTSILLKEISKTKIPVSCTEQGRWAYSSKEFVASGNVLSHSARLHKHESVRESLMARSAHSSNQGEVWDYIAALHLKAGTQSATGAMNDVFKAREDALRKCSEVFTCVPNQVGLLAFIDGAPAGLEFLSRSSAYAKIHSKLVRSYTLESVLERTAGTSSAASATPPDLTAAAQSFLKEIEAAEERPFPSVAYGTDLRYRSAPTPAAGADSSTLNSRAPTISGSCLVHQNEVIHAAFFSLDTAKPAPMASFRRRRENFWP